MSEKFKLKKIGSSNIRVVRELAQKIFPDNYAEILTQEQIDYMMQMMYSEKVLQNQLENGIDFYLIEFNHENVGYLAVEPHHKFDNDLYIHKIYLLPKMQGKGLGSVTINQVEQIANHLKLPSISLNVNRFNNAKFFYEKVGFTVIKEEDIDIGNGYWMNDYVMQKMVSTD